MAGRSGGIRSIQTGRRPGQDAGTAAPAGRRVSHSDWDGVVMIRCEQAEQLFDTYLDGTLSPSWTAELHAHQLDCSDCRRELAILKACGDVVATDRSEPRPSADFTDLVMGALAERREVVIPWPRRVAKVAAGLGTAAAAAMVAFMIMVPRDIERRETAVAGQQVSIEEVLDLDRMIHPMGAALEQTRNLGQVGNLLLKRMLAGPDEKIREMFLSPQERPDWLAAPFATESVEPSSVLADPAAAGLSQPEEQP